MTKKSQKGTRRPAAATKRKTVRATPVMIALAIILLCGLGLRLGYLAELRHTPDFDYPLVDADYHDYWARTIVAGHASPPEFEPDPKIGTTPYFRPPGYPFFLAGAYALLGPGYVGPRVLQALLGLLSAGLAFAIGRRLFDPVTGLIACALMSVYWIFIYFEGEFLEPVIAVPLILAFVLVMLRWRERPSPLGALSSGVLLGLLALARPNALLLAPLGIWWVWWVGRRSSGAPQLVRAGALFVLGMFLAVAPVTIRNYVSGDDLVLISSNAGINLIIGYSERADGEVRGTIPGIGSLDTSFDYPQIVRRVEQLEGRPMAHSEVSSYLTDMALKRMRQDPARALTLLLRKTALFWGPGEVADNKVVALDRANSAVLRRIPISFPLVLSIGVLGFVLAFVGIEARERWERYGDASSGEGTAVGVLLRDLKEASVLILGVVLIWFASHLPFAVTSRYRVPVIPFLIVFGAYFIRWIVLSIRAKRTRRVVPWAIALGALLLLTHVNVSGYEADAARWHYQRGIAYMRSGDLDRAVDEYRAALDQNPDYVSVYNDIAAALATQGRLAESLPYLQEAARRRPQDPTVHLNLGGVLELLGRWEESNRHYAEAMRLLPSEPARAGLERTRSRLGNPPDGGQEAGAR